MDIPNYGLPIIGTPYKVGDPIGNKWIVHGLIGRGGMGIVYFVYRTDSNSFSALKSFREEYLGDLGTHRAFRREVEVWIGLERHPYIVEALWVEEISGRLYVEMDYIPPAEGIKGSSLEFYLKKGALREEQALKWAIQSCYGMEHAYQHGIKCHRDIKPQNILIDPVGNVRISDFGLAKALDQTEVCSFADKDDMKGSLMSQSGRGGCGTPPYMPPEQFRIGAADVRNDIYSFGVVLYEMVTGELPYTVAGPHSQSPEAMRCYWEEWERVHWESPVPDAGGETGKVIRKCLAKKRQERYGSFGDIREVLAGVYRSKAGQTIQRPAMGIPGVVEWHTRGAQLHALGRYQEAVVCYDKALEINPRNAETWNNKGLRLADLGRYQEAVVCFDKALEINPRNAGAWNNKGNSLASLGRYQEAVSCFDKALEINPIFAEAWSNKGNRLADLGRYQEAVVCYDKALEINPIFAEAWSNKGNRLADLGRYQEAVVCYDKALEINPIFAEAWYNKGNSLDDLGRYQEAVVCYEKALEINHRNAGAWNNKGNSLASLGRYQEAVSCFDKALAIDPGNVVLHCVKAEVYVKNGKYKLAIDCYKSFISYQPTQNASLMERAIKRVKELEGG